MYLDNLAKKSGDTKKAKRVGRGCGSGKGMHTTGRGQKGQLSRTGGHLPVGHEGGQIPLFKRLPHIGGFKSIKSRKASVVSLDVFNGFRKGSKISPKDLVEKGILKKHPKFGVKILGNGTLEKELTFAGFLMSASAKAKIEESGSKILNG
jgi:large subunit ribosomal protein L15